MARILEIEAMVARFDASIAYRLKFVPIPFPTVDVFGLTFFAEPSGGMATLSTKEDVSSGRATLSRVEPSIGAAQLSRVEPSLGIATLSTKEDVSRGGPLIGPRIGIALRLR